MDVNGVRLAARPPLRLVENDREVGQGRDMAPPAAWRGTARELRMDGTDWRGLAMDLLGWAMALAIVALAILCAAQ